jgi:hypothetical protein
MKNLAITIALISLLSCNSSDKESESKLDSFFEQNTNSQTFYIKADSLNSFETSSGLVIEISRSDIQNPDGGELRLEVIEVYDKAGMVFNRLSTNTTEGELLESKGMFNFQIFSGESPVDLKEGGKIRLKFPRKEDLKSYTLYDGSLNNQFIEWTDSKINRIDTFIYKTGKEIPLDYGQEGIELMTYYLTGTDTIYREREFIYPENYPKDVATDTAIFPSNVRQSAYYMFEPLKLDWINIDKLIESDSSASLFVLSDTSFIQEHYLIFKNRNSVLSSFRESNPVFDGIPLGEELQLISVANINDHLMYSVNSFTLDAPLELKIKYTEVTEAELKVLIEGINENGS